MEDYLLMPSNTSDIMEDFNLKPHILTQLKLKSAIITKVTTLHIANMVVITSPKETKNN